MAEKQTFDRTSDYGIVYGDTRIGFEQDGVHFSHDGKFVEAWSTAEAIANEAVQAKRRKAKEDYAAKIRQSREAIRKAEEDEDEDNVDRARERLARSLNERLT